jgi:hypothetical protein
LNVTGTLTVVRPVELTAILPLRTCVVVRPAVLIETVKACGVVPDAGETLNHEFPEVTAALTATLVDALVLTFNVCDAGAVRPVVQLNVMLVGLGTRFVTTG